MSDNRIKLLERVGEGGMSTVWKAWDESRGCYVAVKVLAGEFAASGRDIASFREEERVMEEMDNPGIVKAYGFEQDGDGCRMIMEYVDGYTFGDLLRRKQHVGEADCLLICESVAAALDAAWNDHGVVHCDIKPENIMINSEGVVKLTDLGIFHRYEQREGTLEPPDQVMGTPAYISPEQVYGDVEVDCRSDIYSLAATLYHLSTGRTLFPGLGNEDTMRAHCSPTSQARDPRSYRPALSEGFCQLLESMLVKDRDYRVTNWQDIYQMCLEVEAGQKFKPRETAATAPSSLLLNQ